MRPTVRVYARRVFTSRCKHRRVEFVDIPQRLQQPPHGWVEVCLRCRARRVQGVDGASRWSRLATWRDAL